MKKKLVFKKNNNGKRLAYFPLFKQKKKQISKELLKELISTIEHKNFSKKVIYRDSCVLSVVKIKPNNLLSNTTSSYVLSLKKNGLSKRYFLKKISPKEGLSLPQFLMGATAVNEIVALNFVNSYLKKNKTTIGGFDLKVVLPHFAFEDVNLRKSYVLYDYVGLENLKASKEVSLKQKKAIEQELRLFSKKINNVFIKNHPDLSKYYINKWNKIKDILIRNTFVDIKKKTIYLSDLYF